jgi:peroxiredoxin
MLQLNKPAPDFTLHSTPDQIIQLSQLRGKKVILAFYPADWSPVCSDQMALYNETLPLLRKYNAEVLGISVDGKWCHLAFSKDRNLHFPLLADFEPKGEVAKLYESYDMLTGECRRTLYLLDEKGIIRWSYFSPIGINPGIDGILNALEQIKVNE